MIRSAGLAIVAGLALVFVVPARAQTDDPIVAVVDGDAIREFEVRAAAAPYVPRVPTTLPRTVRERVLERLIDARLIEHAAARDGIEVTDAEVDAAIANVPALATAPAPSPPTDEDRRDIRAQMLRFRLLNRRMGGRVYVTDQQVRARYEALVVQARRQSRFDCAQILFPIAPGAGSPEIDRARHAAEALRESIHDDADFEDAMPDHGGRELHDLTQGSLDVELEETLMDLEEGEVSPVMRGTRGVFILLLRARHSAADSVPDYESVRANILAILRARAISDLEPTLMEELRRAATIQRMLDE